MFFLLLSTFMALFLLFKYMILFAWHQRVLEVSLFSVLLNILEN